LGYAVKANPMPAVVQHLAGLVDALDVASSHEMQIALDTPMPASRVSFAGPGKTAAEIAQAVAAGVTIELESPTEARRVVEAGNRLGLRPRVAVRVNPDFQVKGSGMRMGGGPQQFGLDVEQVPALLGELAREDVEVLGFGRLEDGLVVDREVVDDVAVLALVGTVHPLDPGTHDVPDLVAVCRPCRQDREDDALERALEHLGHLLAHEPPFSYSVMLTTTR